MPMNDDREDPPLPATVGFVIALGLVFVGGWLLMFKLLLARW